MATQPAPPLLSCADISVSVPGRMLVKNLQLELQPGEMIAVLGQNGAGKTLSLLTLAGLRQPQTGQIRIGASDIQDIDRSSVAKQVALLPQDVEDIFPATVIDTALIGRHPHIGHLHWESAEDHAIAQQALQTVGLTDLAERDVATLSGGERRRVAIAQVLAQQPQTYLLDEPTNHLDPQHQLDTMRIFRKAADAGAGVIATLHDVNLAVRFADRCLLLFGDGRWSLGANAEVLSEALLSDLFATPMESVPWRSHNLFIAGNP
jgi:iron complex transport system ATP-binding protein